MATSNDSHKLIVVSEKHRRIPIRKTVGRLLMRLVGLFQIGIGPYWFISEVGFLGRIERWDIGVTMAILSVLGFVLLLRPSCRAGLITGFVYAGFLIYQLVVFRSSGPLAESIIVCIPPSLVIVGALLVADSASECLKSNDNKSHCDNEKAE